MKYGEAVKVVREYSDIHMPKNTALGLYIALASFFFGFGLVWHMFWMSVLALVAIVTLVIMRSFDDETSYILTKEEILRFEKKHKTL
jgi:cytochrome o ubiquinol oxidase subunit 1